MIIVISGELELVKRNLNDVFFNEDFGVVGIKEQNAKQRLLKS